MRLSLLLCKGKNHARAYQNENKVPLKPTQPLALKNEISGKLRHDLEDKCLYEMSLLFKCWKENEFNDKSCAKDMQNLQQCYKSYTKKAAAEKQRREIGIPTPGSKTFTSKQINYLLRMYPTV